MKVIVPPIKSQGIKTKLVPWINEVILSSDIDLSGNWIEPFFGTGVVGFNTVVEGSRIIGDSNPYIINFYGKPTSGCRGVNMQFLIKKSAASECSGFLVL